MHRTPQAIVIVRFKSAARIRVSGLFRLKKCVLVSPVFYVVGRDSRSHCASTAFPNADAKSRAITTIDDCWKRVASPQGRSDVADGRQHRRSRRLNGYIRRTSLGRKSGQGQCAFGPALIVLAFSEPLRGAVSFIRWKQSGSDHGHAYGKTYQASSQREILRYCVSDLQLL